MYVGIIGKTVQKKKKEKVTAFGPSMLLFSDI